MRPPVATPVSRQDQPAVPALDDALELARIEESAWPAIDAELDASGALLNRAEPGAAPAAVEPGSEEEPTADDDHSAETEPGAEGDENETEDPLGEFDLESLPPEARQAFEAADKRRQADYTRKTQELARDREAAGQYQAIVEGLEDPERAPEILRILNVPTAQQPTDEWFTEEDEIDPNQRIDALERQLAERQENDAIAEIQSREDQTIAEEIEAFEKANETEFSKEEIAFLYLYADEIRDEQGAPNTRAAIDLLEGIVGTRQQAWIDGKLKTPRPMPKGKAASKAVDLTKETKEDRVSRMAAAAEAARGSAE